MPAPEARVHASIVAGVLWTVAAASLLTPGSRDPFNTLKGGDFVHFYTLGDSALARSPSLLYDEAALHARQVALVPASANDRYIPVYPPHTGVLFAPFAALPYAWAFLAWSVCVAGLYAVCVYRAWRAVSRADFDGWTVAIAAAAFPPFWNLILHGQTSIVPMLAFTGAAVSYVRGNRVMAGVFLGLLALKPQFAIVAGVVLLMAREGRMIAGVCIAGALQMLVAAAVFGPGIWLDYARVIGEVSGRVALLEPRPYQLHSIRALTRLLPAPVELIVWTAAGAAVIWMVWHVWRTSSAPLFKFGVLILASVLVNPHLTVYDATVLVPAALWIGAWVSSSRQWVLHQKFWSLAYWTFAAFLAPTAWLLGVQLSVVLLLLILLTVTWSAEQPRSSQGPGG